MQVNFLKRGFPSAVLRVVSGILAWGTVAAVAQTLPPVANFILGSGLRQCGSYNGAIAGSRCTADWNTILAQDPVFAGWSLSDLSLQSDQPPPNYTYSITPESIARLRAAPAHLIDSTKRAKVLEMLDIRLATEGAQRGLSFEALDHTGAVSPTLSRLLTLPEQAVLRAALVDRQNPQRQKKEAVSVAFSAVDETKTMFAAFLAAARAANGGRAPTIGLVTASTPSHPFVSYDYLMTALQSAGANAVYLALDGGMRQAIDRNDCANLIYYSEAYANSGKRATMFHADLGFADVAAIQRRQCENGGAELNKALESVDAIYFTGGDQVRHLESLIQKDAKGNLNVPSKQLQILRSRYAAGRLVVIGHSAGDHIQGGGLWRGKPVAMIEGGDPYDVLRRGFQTGRGVAERAVPKNDGEANEQGRTPYLYPYGGLGVFNFGVLDSHFSQRTREARLTRATLDSGMDYGFGVDERTALVVHRPDAEGTTQLAVMGPGGVFIVDARKAQSPSKADAYAVSGVRAHYLRPGDTASIDAAGQLRVTLQPGSPLLPAVPDAPTQRQTGVMDYGSSNFLKLAQRMGTSGALHGFGSTEESKDKVSRQDRPYYSVTLTRDANTEFRSAVDGTVSYTGLLLQFSPCQGTCHAP